MSATLFFNDGDGQFRTIGCSEPDLDLQIRRHNPVADLVGIAESIELEQFGRDGDAAGMSPDSARGRPVLSVVPVPGVVLSS